MLGLLKPPHAQPREIPRSLEQRNTIGNRRNAGVLAHCAKQTLQAFVVPARAECKGPCDHGREPSAAKFIRPNGQSCRLFLDAVMIDDNHVDSQPMR